MNSLADCRVRRTSNSGSTPGSQARKETIPSASSARAGITTCAALASSFRRDCSLSSAKNFITVLLSSAHRTGLQRQMSAVLALPPHLPLPRSPACHGALGSSCDATGRAVSPPVSYTHLRAHETKANLVCRLLLEKKKNKQKKKTKKQKNKNNKTKKQKTKKNK